MALLAGTPEKLPEHSKKSAVKAKEDKPSTSVSTHVQVIAHVGFEKLMFELQLYISSVQFGNAP